MSNISFRLIVLKTNKLPEALAFYQKLGITFKEERHGNGPIRYAGHLGDVVLELYPLPSEVREPDSTTRLGFAVANLEATLRAIQGQMASDTDARRAVVRDPDGRAVELYQV